MLIVVWLLGQLLGIVCGAVKQVNVFVTPGETWLLFPHRQFYLYTYSTTCSSKSSQASIEYKQFKTISSIPIDNTCLHIDVLKSSPDKNQTFFYGKLTKEGVCTVYRVHNDTVSIFYQYPSEKQFTNLLMMNELNVFVWNAREFIKLEYSLYSSQINVYSMQFPSEDQRKCTINNAYSLFCWKDDELMFLNFLNYHPILTVYPYDSDSIVQIFPLSPQDQSLLICSMQTCNISLIQHGRISVQQSLSFIGQIMGGSVHESTNTFVIVMSESLCLYSFNFYEKIELTLLDTINFPSEFECSHYDHSLLLSDLIIVECFNFEGQPQKLVLNKDVASNYFFAFDPMDRSNYSNSWVSASKNELLILYEDEIEIKETNFYFLALSNPESQQGLQPVELVCVRFDTVGSKEQNHYLITILQAKLGQAYPNERLDMAQSIVYNQLLNFELSHYFKASDILSYKFTTNCSFIDPLTYTSISYQQYFSLYNRQRCVQIVAGGGKLFYRLLEINSTLFYVEECLPLTVGFGCQLIDIYDRVESPQLAVGPEGLYGFYIQNEQLKVKNGQRIRSVFSQPVLAFEIIDAVVRVKSREGYQFSQISGLMGTTCKWQRQASGDRYFFEGTSVLQMTADQTLIEHVGSQVRVLLNRQELFDILSRTSQFSQQLSYPFLLKQGDFTFIIYKFSITKVYMRSSPILLYSMPINPRKREINDVRITDIYLTIQYEPSGFEIYDITQQAIAARVAALQEKILTDIISLDTRTILIPIQSTTSLIVIDRAPMISIGTFSPKYHLFHEVCKFTLALFRQSYNSSETFKEAGTSSENQSNIYQSFTLQIKYYIEQIDLDDTIQVQQYPQYCDNCTLKLQQFSYFGPIFTYELNDDYYGQFQLIPHLTVQQCLPSAEQTLRGLLQVRFEGDYLNSEVLMMDGSRLYLMDSELTVLNSFRMQNTDYCSSYLKINEQYLVLCDKYFLLISKKEIKGTFLHNLSIRYENRSQFELQFQQMTDNLYYLIILDHDIEAHIYQLSLQSRSIQHLQKYNFKKVIDDLKVINNKVIILKYQYICISNATFHLSIFDSAVQKCFLLADIIPRNYASAYNYEAFIPYFSDGTLIRALLIAKSVEDLHIDIEIDLTTPYKFRIINVYAGYVRFALKEIIAVNMTSNSYSYFILLYQCEDTSDYMVAYYKFNSRYTFDGTIGQIRSSQLLSNYFYNLNHLSFTSFRNQMFITHSKLTATGRGFQKKKQCLVVTVKDQLSVILNYKQVPPIKFLILQARNLNQMSNHFIRMRFIPSADQAQQILICLIVLLSLLAGIVLSTNQCKNTESDLETDMIFEQVEGPSGDDQSMRSRDGSWPLSEEKSQFVRDSTSLLHSKESEYVPPNEYQESDENGSEVIILRSD